METKMNQAEEQVLKTLRRGLCHPKRAEAEGCNLCLETFRAIDQITAWLEDARVGALVRECLTVEDETLHVAVVKRGKTTRYCAWLDYGGADNALKNHTLDGALAALAKSIAAEASAAPVMLATAAKKEG